MGTIAYLLKGVSKNPLKALSVLAGLSWALFTFGFDYHSSKSTDEQFKSTNAMLTQVLEKSDGSDGANIAKQIILQGEFDRNLALVREDRANGNSKAFFRTYAGQGVFATSFGPIDPDEWLKGVGSWAYDFGDGRVLVSEFVPSDSGHDDEFRLRRFGSEIISPVVRTIGVSGEMTEDLRFKVRLSRNLDDFAYRVHFTCEFDIDPITLDATDFRAIEGPEGLPANSCDSFSRINTRNSIAEMEF